MHRLGDRMADTGLKGPFPLRPQDIDNEITPMSPGVYALDRSHEDGPFHVSYVGRSDTDLRARLDEQAGKYRRFKYAHHALPRRHSLANAGCTMNSTLPAPS